MDRARTRSPRETKRIPSHELDALRRRPRTPPGPSLIVYLRDGATLRLLSQAEPLVVGRDPASPGSVAVDDPALSREHARFCWNGDAVVVEDLGSKNGTWIHGEKIERAELAAGDEVHIGAVIVVLHGEAGLRRGLRPVNHERFRCAVEDEIVRAKHFNRSFALLMIRSASATEVHVSRFLARVTRQLSAIDRVALYSPETLEILLPEARPDGAIARAKAIVRNRTPPLLAGVAVYPDTASDAEALLDRCRRSLLGASLSARVNLASVVASRSAQAAGDQEDAVVESPALQVIFDKIGRVASSTLSILILGETGVGKEVIARQIHEQSQRRNKPFEVVNCAAIPAALIEATLFGHEKGAFTDARESKAGLFEAANRGTLLLDEIGDLPKPAQAALLRALESGKVRPVGATRETAVDVRVLAATHCDLEGMVAEGAFRKDLLFRLTGFVIEIPPLRDRPEEIAPLAMRFVERAARANGRSVTSIDAAAMALLTSYAWPGNIRELRNAIEQAVVLSQTDAVAAGDLPERVRAGRPSPPRPPQSAALPRPPTAAHSPQQKSNAGEAGFREMVRAFEKQLLLDALDACKGNQRAAASRLGLAERTFAYKLKTLRS